MEKNIYIFHIRIYQNEVIFQYQTGLRSLKLLQASNEDGKNSIPQQTQH